ncbi:WD40-repeat-containing domain protein [Pavlovales sp. CCMP2436]|nr:WD40-repeat-containing domain protein [Pavlovales sp. CCMP2436]KAJ1636809.1 WD40-repeat-containing domain protein [Pavlovales sp. CCMP2436]|mmetsp:Transcript_42591/g.104914  ORF Transcript_42591/g.104914 Transcript_42591/m.104914 type:complete len:342 (-) Transcript_42591:37-1062(-)
MEEDGRYHMSSRPYCVKWTPDGALLAVGDDDSRVHVLDASTRSVQRVLNDSGAVDALPTLAICWRPEVGPRAQRHILLEGTCAGVLSHWHVPSGKRMHSVRQPGNAIHCLSYACDGWAFATSGKDACVRIHEEATKSEVVVFKGGEERGSLVSSHVQQVFCVRFHNSNPQLLASGGWDKVVHLWDVRTGKSVSTFSGPFMAGDCLDLHENDLLAGSNGREHQVCLFDLRRPGSAPATALTIEPAPGRRDDNDPYTVYACKFSRDPQRKLIGIGCGTAGSGNGVLKVYDRAARQFVESIELKGRSVYSLDFAPPSLPATSLAFTAGSKAGSFVQVLEVSPSQ